MTVPVIAIGVVGIVIGIVLIAKRRIIASGISKGQKDLFGRPGEMIAKQSKPVGVAIAGAGFVLIGIASIVMGIFIPPDQF